MNNADDVVCYILAQTLRFGFIERKKKTVRIRTTL